MHGKRKSSLWVLFVALLVSSLLASTLAACSSPAPAPGPAATAAPTAAAKAPAAATAAAKATTAPASNLAKEQTLSYPSTEPPSMDPGLATDSVSIQLLLQVFEGLVEFDNEGKPVPMAAEKWEISPDGKTYTFTIRKGLKWSNGDPLTAKDFEYAWKRNLDPATASDYANTLYPIKGAEAFNTKKSTDPNSVGVTAKDDETLVVNLEEPAGFFLRLVSTWTAYPLPRKTIEANKDKWTEASNIVSNGPFKMQSWKHDSEMVLVRNDNYWGTRPTLDKVVIKIFAQSDQQFAQQLAAYENGEIDFTELAPADVDRVKNDAKLGKEYKTFTRSGTFFVVPNSGKKPFNDARVRQALALAIDPVKAIDVIKQVAIPAEGINPPGIEGRKPSAYEKQPNVAKAKQLLADAGYPNGQGFPEFTYTYNTGSINKVLAEYLQEAWTKELGLKVKIDAMEWKVFLKWRLEADYDLFRGGWLSDYEDPYNWFNVLLDSSQSPAHFAPHWKNDQFDKLVRQALAETDAAKRKSLYEQADEILGKEMPFIPLYHYGGQMVLKQHVDGWRTDRLGHHWFKTVKILSR